MGLFNKLQERRVPPGIELRILRKIPHITVAGSLVPIALAVLVRVLPLPAGVDEGKYVRSVDIFAIAAEITFLTAVLTVTIACFIIYVMKGPAYVADPYPLQHSDRPARRDDRQKS